MTALMASSRDMASGLAFCVASVASRSKGTWRHLSKNSLLTYGRMTISHRREQLMIQS